MAKTIGKDIVDPSIVDPVLILAGLVGAIAWNLLTWWWGLPSSSSHALIGGFAGAALAKGGLKVLVAKGLEKTAAFIVLSPLFGLALGFVFFLSVIWIFRRARPEPVDRIFRRVQLFSAAAFSFGHGLNDAQKTMGIIAVLLFSTGHLKHLEIPFWIILLCHAAIALGTLAGGWRIVRTMGMRITALKPVGGSCAEFAGAFTLFGASWAGIPVSTTHTITGAIMGVGSVPLLRRQVGRGPNHHHGLGRDDPHLGHRGGNFVEGASRAQRRLRVLSHSEIGTARPVSVVQRCTMSSLTGKRIVLGVTGSVGSPPVPPSTNYELIVYIPTSCQVMIDGSTPLKRGSV